MSNKTWKQRERNAAKTLGTLRKPGSGSQGRSDQTCSDSMHETIFLEHKHSQRHAVLTVWKKARDLAKKEKKTPVVSLSLKGHRGIWYVVHQDHLEELAGVVSAAKAAAKAAAKVAELPGQTNFLETP
jgi:hypothetical protein